MHNRRGDTPLTNSALCEGIFSLGEACISVQLCVQLHSNILHGDFIMGEWIDGYPGGVRPSPARERQIALLDLFRKLPTDQQLDLIKQLQQAPNARNPVETAPQPAAPAADGSHDSRTVFVARVGLIL
jgi:hypothetical protein